MNCKYELKEQMIIEIPIISKNSSMRTCIDSIPGIDERVAEEKIIGLIISTPIAPPTNKKDPIKKT